MTWLYIYRPSGLILGMLLCFPFIVLSFSPIPSLRHQRSHLILSSTSSEHEIHPAVAEWPEKYGGSIISGGPRILHSEFVVEPASLSLLTELDVTNWPTWTTGDKEKWVAGNQNADKIMPYGELSYMLSGKLEIIPASTGQPVIVHKGDFVTFPKDFQASWRVLEELTWNYYLY